MVIKKKNNNNNSTMKNICHISQPHSTRVKDTHPHTPTREHNYNLPAIFQEEITMVKRMMFRLSFTGALRSTRDTGA